MMLGHDKQHGAVTCSGIRYGSWAAGDPHPPRQGEDKVLAISLARQARLAANLS